VRRQDMDTEHGSAIVGGTDRLHRLAKIDTPDDMDPSLAEFRRAAHGGSNALRRPPRQPVSAAATTSADNIGSMDSKIMHSIMDHQGQMASLGSSSIDSANPVIARMAIKDPAGSPGPDTVSLNLMHQDDEAGQGGDGDEPPSRKSSGGDSKTPTGSTREPPPPHIILPAVASPAAILANARPAQVQTPSSSSIPATPPSASSRDGHLGLSIGRVPSAATAAAAPPPPFAQMPILVVDDDSLTRMLMKRLLTRLGCKVTTAENGEAALELITGSPRPTPLSEDAPPTPVRTAASDDSHSGAGTIQGQWTPESKFAVVFLDNQMPVLSGLEAVARLRSAGRRDFVVGVTGEWSFLSPRVR
jgi:osomolarity two-component system sensor histidine kinase SLN1